MKLARIAVVASVLTWLNLGTAEAALVYTGTPLTETFDSLTSVQSSTSSADLVVWANDSTLPGWSLFNQTGAAITGYKGGDGSINTGAFYSFGAQTVAERALGGVASGGAYFGSPASGSVAGWITVGITNSTGSTISSFDVEYDGEQWRDGGNSTPTAQTMTLEYGFGASFGSVGSWTAPGAGFNFTSPTFTTTAGALNGNAPGNRAADLGGSVSSLSWASGDTLWLRWIENNDVGNDHGLSIDNFEFSAQIVPEPSMLVLASLAAIGLVIAPRRRKRNGAT